jgi:hypothetical protein
LVVGGGSPTGAEVISKVAQPGLGCISVEEYLSSMCKGLGSIPINQIQREASRQGSPLVLSVKSPMVQSEVEE